MNKHLPIQALFLTGCLSLTGCKKETDVITPDNPTTSSSTGTYLKFSNAEALKKTIAELSKATDKQAALQNLRGSYSQSEPTNEFHSLLANPQKNSSVYQAKGKMALTSAARTGAVSNRIDAELAQNELVADQMVPDPNWATVLSDELEIEVGGMFYKVTPQGTLFTEAANKAALEAMASDNEQDPNDVDRGTYVADNLYNMGDGVSRYDTFGSATTVELQPVNEEAAISSGTSISNATAGTYSTPCGIAQPASSQYSPTLTTDQYCSFPSYGYGSHTIVGGWLQGIFGANSDRTEDFDGKHRIKVKLYNFNYWVYSSIGLKAKFQQKGWTQIWDKRDCDKIVLGWDAVVFESPLVYSMPNPQPTPSFPTNQVGKAVAAETFKFINFEVPAGMISEFSSGILGNYSWNSPSKIEQDLKQLDKTLLSTVSKDLWDYVANKYAPGQLAFQKSTTTGFRMIFPDKVTIALSRWEKASNNTGEVDMIFDWNTCRVTYNGTIGGDFNFADNVLKPTYSNKAFSYTVKKASVYGAALYGGKWKGVRIIQE
jgi:hypothetical protein